MRRQKQNPTQVALLSKWLLDMGMLLFTLVIGLSGSALLYRAIATAESVQRHERLAAIGQSVVDSFDLDLTRVMEAVKGISLTVASRDKLLRSEFALYCNSVISDSPSLSFVEWQPVVPIASLPQFLAAARADGMPDFRLMEPVGNGMIPVRPRPEYVPVLYACPEKTGAIGIDMGFDPARMRSKLKARDSGRPVASETFTIIQAGAVVADTQAFAISAPVFRPDTQAAATISERRARLMGYVAGVVQLPDIFREAAFRADASRLDLLVFDQGPDTRKLIFSAKGDDSDLPTNLDGGFQAGPQDLQITVEVGTRPWDIVIHPRGAFFAREGLPRDQLALAAGSIATLLVTLALFATQLSRRRMAASRAATAAAEQALAEERQRLRNILDGTNAGTWEWNIQTGELRLNERWAAILGMTLAELAPIGIETWRKLSHPLDLQRSDQLLKQHFSGELDYFDCEMRLMHKANHWRWVLVRGRVFSSTRGGEPEWMAGTLMDISGSKDADAERKQVSEQLHTTLAIQAAIVNSSDDAIISKTPFGVITSWNPGAESMFGYTAEEAIDQPISLLVPASHMAEEQAVLERVRQGSTVEHFEAPRRCKDGTLLDVSITLSPIRDAAGAVIGVSAVKRSIAERKLRDAAMLDTQQLLAQAKEAAEATSRAKSDFLASMSHEIRTPMNGILGMLKLLQHTDLSPRQLDYAVKTQSAAESLLGIINDILDFSKVESGKMTLEIRNFPLERLLRDLSVLVSAGLGKKNVELLFAVDAALPSHIAGDALRLQQVLLNLISNAVKFTSQGEVIVALRALATTAEYTEIHFSVQDSGIGIAADKLKYIFEGFSQAEASTTRRFGGTGLGLAISQRLVAMMGGTLEVMSKQGVGSTFFFTLRFATGQRGEDEQDNSVFPPLPLHLTGKQIRALVVDDNDQAREALRQMCKSLHWHADTASSAADAIAILGESKDKPAKYDIVFMDWQMPIMDGLEATRTIRQRQPDDKVPIVILVTGQNRDLLMQALQKHPIALDGFLMKPVTASMLLEALVDTTTPEADIKRKASTPTKERLAGMHILVVEDNLLNQRVASELLTREGASVDVAGGGTEGVRRTLQASPPYDIVLMDIQMPDMDGYAATREIRRKPGMQTQKIIAMTANAMAADKAACLEAGMNDHISKPIDVDTMVNTLLRHAAATGDVAAPLPRTAPAASNTTENPAPVVQDDLGALQAALRRLANDEALFVNMAQLFIQNAQELPQTLQQCLEKGETTEAARLLHTLKGTAGIVGAQRLMDFAAQAEKRLRNKGPDEALADMTSEFSTLLQHSCHVLQDYIRQLQPEAADLVARELTTADCNDLIAALDTLLPLMQEHNMRAMSVFADLQGSYAAALGQQLVPLEQALNELDFGLAVERAEQLKVMLVGGGALMQ